MIMRGADLARELCTAVVALEDHHRTALISYGVDPDDIALGMVGAALIRVAGDTYEPDPDAGKPAFITPVRVHDAHSPENHLPASYVRLGTS